MYMGSRQIAAHKMQVGDFMMYTSMLAFMVAPVVQVVNIGTQLSEALAGLERTRQIMKERPEDEDPNRHHQTAADSTATCSLRTSSSRTKRTSRCCTAFR